MGGEPLFRADVDRFNRHYCPHCVLVHPFGPTETMAVCWTVVPHGAQIAGYKVPIGYTLKDKKCCCSTRPVDRWTTGRSARLR